MKKKIKEFIEKNQLTCMIIDHGDSDGLTSQGAEDSLGVDVGSIIKVLLFIDKNKNLAVAIAQGDKKIDSKNIPGLKKPRIASVDELKEYIDCEPGGVPPICLPKNVPKYIDESLKNKDYVFGSGGDRYTGLKIKIEDIIKYNENIHWKELVI